MSHLSKIKTKITHFETLTRTLNQLDLEWKNISNSESNKKPSILLWSNNKELTYNAELKWCQTSYELTADSNTWQGKRLLDAITEKIQQQYAYNTILVEGTKQGFSNIESNILQDGSLRLVLEKWNM